MFASERTLIPLQTRLRYTTLVVLPPDEEIIDVICGDKDWWVISARVGVRASAEIRTAILWQRNQPVQMAVAAELYVSAYAEACIGPSWARVCKDISVGLDITVRHQLRFG